MHEDILEKEAAQEMKDEPAETMKSPELEEA
jgi:hypothetical protein